MKQSGVIEGIKNNIHSDSHLTKHAREACLALIDYLMTSPPSTNSDMSIGFLSNVVRQRTGQVIEDEQVFEAAQYLISGRARLLDLVMTYEDPYSDLRHKLTIEEEKKVIQDNQFNHPITKEAVEDFANYLFLSFKRSQFAQDEYHKRHSQAA